MLKASASDVPVQWNSANTMIYAGVTCSTSVSKIILGTTDDEAKFVVSDDWKQDEGLYYRTTDSTVDAPDVLKAITYTSTADSTSSIRLGWNSPISLLIESLLPSDAVGTNFIVDHTCICDADQSIFAWIRPVSPVADDTGYIVHVTGASESGVIVMTHTYTGAELVVLAMASAEADTLVAVQGDTAATKDVAVYQSSTPGVWSAPVVAPMTAATQGVVDYSFASPSVLAADGVGIYSVTDAGVTALTQADAIGTFQPGWYCEAIFAHVLPKADNVTVYVTYDSGATFTTLATLTTSTGTIGTEAGSLHADGIYWCNSGTTDHFIGIQLVVDGGSQPTAYTLAMSTPTIDGVTEWRTYTPSILGDTHRMVRVTMTGSVDTLLSMTVSGTDLEEAAAENAFVNAATIQFSTLDTMTGSTAGGVSTTSGVGVDRVWVMGGTSDAYSTETYYTPVEDEETSTSTLTAVLWGTFGSVLILGFGYLLYRSIKADRADEKADRAARGR